MFLPNYYKSTATFYVNNSANLDPKNIFGDRPTSFFGDEIDVNRVKFISQSKAFKDQIIKEFNLTEYLDIDTTDKIKRETIYVAFKDIVKLKKDEDGTTSITVEHKNPELAAKMANRVVELLEKRNSEIISNFLLQQEKFLYEQVIANDLTHLQYEEVIQDIKNDYHIIVDIASTDQKTMIYSPSSTEFDKEFNQGIDKLQFYSSSYLESINNFLEQKKFLSQYSTTIGMINQTQIKSLNILEYATPNYKKTKPKRSIIVVSIFILSLLVFSYIFSLKGDK